ncbi:Uncharacterized protein involved in exopolysaccharide biosynthesis [Devosia crocina]|uniref:Uncharacterized protein involved in exopolysaccharide biosynthesis n=1 Tax=Devosia crocina TaxID=429728 RepID=A0A1I7NR97_9HYPH|nr:GumC family protein [Devosia crocina]SFV37214.1 Uncharacterized protein involved in exopolysaccharide biosynthesis [Devosia crocina]
MYKPLQPDNTAPPASSGGETAHVYRGPERRKSALTIAGLINSITPALLMGWLRRFWIGILAVAMLGALAGLAAGMLIPPRYTSYSDILLNPSSLQIVADDLYASNVQGDAQLLEVESKMRVLGSTNVLARVVRDLDLTNNADLMAPGFSLSSLFLSGGSGIEEDRNTAAIRALSERIRIRREERSYIVTASVWAHSPEQSAILTRALVSAFLAELAEAEADGARSASSALGLRLDELRRDAEQAEAAVADYRRDNGLQIVGTDQLSTQSAVQLNGQIAAAREALFDAEARYSALTAGGQQGGVIAAAAQESTVLANMRTQYATTRQQVDSLAITLGPRHPSLTTARAQLATLQEEINQETSRIVQAARQDLERAQRLLDQLNQAATTQMGAVFTDDQAQLELRQLERTAASKVTIYEAYLDRAQEIAERSELSTNNVRVISPAVPPISRSYPPRTLMLIGAGFFAGAMAGIMLAFGLGLRRLYLERRSRLVHA